MNRREFITNSVLAAAGTALLGGCRLEGDKSKKKTGERKVVTRKFKDLDIPLLSLGCMRLPKINGKIDMPQFEKMVDYAIRHGVNYFDTAYMYHEGESENAVGKVLSNYKRSSFLLATKNPIRALTSKADVRKLFEEQLKKCQTDYFDFYLAHNISTLTVDNYRNYDVYNELMKFKEEGKVKHVGFSYHGEAALLKEVANEHPWEFCQIQFNYLDWTARKVKENYEVLRKANIPIVSMTPLRGGALTNLAGSAKAVLKDQAPNDTQASFGLRWVAGKEGVLTALSGMSSIENLQENVETFIDYRPFTEKEEKLADRISELMQKQGEINCTTCNYCYDCPRAIKIPVIFSIYNDYKATGDASLFVKKYEEIKDRQKADKCIKCGLCSAHCPQFLNIPPLLEKVDSAVKELKATWRTA